MKKKLLVAMGFAVLALALTFYINANFSPNAGQDLISANVEALADYDLIVLPPGVKQCWYSGEVDYDDRVLCEDNPMCEDAAGVYTWVLRTTGLCYTH